MKTSDLAVILLAVFTAPQMDTKAASIAWGLVAIVLVVSLFIERAEAKAKGKDKVQS